MSNGKMAMTDSTFGDKLQWSLVPNEKPNVATDDHLQSLGLEVDDGLPKFKLNEPGPAALASSIFQQNNMITDDDSEQSFVVLGKTSFESIKEASMASYMEIKEKSTLTDHNSLISMMSPSEIEENLKKVLEENLKLKETLKQNNTAIKLQFNTITKWQKEVMTVCDNHKQKFQETKELISRLKQENDELREKIARKQLQEMSQSQLKELSQSVGEDTLTYLSSSLTSSRAPSHYKDISSSECIPDLSELKKSNEKSDIDQLLWEMGVKPGVSDLDISTPSELKKASEKCDVDQLLREAGLKPGVSNLEKEISKLNISQECVPHPLEQRLNELEKETSKLKDALGTSTYTINSTDFNSLENTCSANFNNLLKEGKKLQDEQNQLKNEQDLLKKVSELTEELTKVKLNYTSTKEVLQELENRYHTDIEIFSQQLQKANKELDSLKQKSNSTNSLELQKLVSNCCEKDLRLKYLEEIIASLELQVKKFDEVGFPLVDLQIQDSQETPEDRRLLREHIECYNAKLTEINKYFATQCVQFLRMQESLRESACIIQVFESANLLPNDIITTEKLKDYKETLSAHRRALIGHQLQSIEEKQAAIKAQQQFQKVFADYNSVICEMEIIKDENSKLQTLQAKGEEENSLKWAEIEKQVQEEKRILEKEKTELLEQSLNIQIDKKQIFEEKRQVEAERTYLFMEKEKLKDEKMSLCEERTSLDRQSKLYEAEEGTLQKEKKALQKRCEYLYCEIDKLKHELLEAEGAIKELKAENNKLKENDELLTVYKIQTEMREKEFEDMRSMHKNLQDQLQNLSLVNMQLRSENDRLGGQERQASTSRFCGLCGSTYNDASEVRHGMGICTPEFD